MDRRNSLKQLMLATGSLVALPAWANGWSMTDLAAHPTSFTVAEQELLSGVVDTIIPKGDAIGALSVGVDKFLQRLFDDCYEPEIQENIKKQLLAVDSLAGKLHGRPFTGCGQQQRQALLISLSESKQKEEKEFFDLVKSETIRGFRTSREVMVDYHGYKVVPGHYYGCVDVNA